MTAHKFKKIEAKYVNDAEFTYRAVGCLVTNHDGKIVLQLRDEFAPTNPNMISTFGGGIEPGESADDALVRELNEELGAIVLLDDVIDLGAIIPLTTESDSIIHMYFWHDQHNTITGCYEGYAKYLNDPLFIEDSSLVTNSASWVIQECKNRGLIK